jgi:hypothetical protein
MDPKQAPTLSGEALNAYMLKREAQRHAATSQAGDSPMALDATLAQISAEMTQEALERLQRAAKPA